VTNAQCFQGGIVSRITPWVASERKSMAKAFSSEVDTGSREENASKQSAATPRQLRKQAEKHGIPAPNCYDFVTSP
jgi:hypothetical protein